MSSKHTLNDRLKNSTNDSTSATGNAFATSALDRIRYNLNPVTSYYKPLMKSFTRRDDSPNKKRDDGDKTPVADEKMSTISRLESKYSEVLGRRRHRELGEREDRDKTLEPDKIGFTPLTRSATTILSSGAVSKKESTPYRLRRNYSDRKPTHTGTSTNNYGSRTDFNSSPQTTQFSVPKSNYLNSPTMRNKDSIYDHNGKRVTTTSHYNKYDNLGLSTKTEYYEGRDRDNNTFKSKYEPSRLYAELNNNEMFSQDRNIPRYHKDYRRTATTNVNNYTDRYLDNPSTSGGYQDHHIRSSRYAPEKSLDYQRSNTQKFFDLETKSSVVRNLNDNESVKSEAVKQREARRKEIQGLIAKYAQIDDVFLRAIDNNTASSDTNNTRNSINNDYSKFNNMRTNDDYSYVADKGVSQYPIMQNKQTSFMPLSKTQSVSSMSSTNRSRIPKTLSTFVRK